MICKKPSDRIHNIGQGQYISYFYVAVIRHRGNLIEEIIYLDLWFRGIQVYHGREALVANCRHKQKAKRLVPIPSASRNRKMESEALGSFTFSKSVTFSQQNCISQISLGSIAN